VITRSVGFPEYQKSPISLSPKYSSKAFWRGSSGYRYRVNGHRADRQVFRKIFGPRSQYKLCSSSPNNPVLIPAVIMAPVDVPTKSLKTSKAGNWRCSSRMAIARETITPLIPPPSTARATFFRKGFIIISWTPLLEFLCSSHQKQLS